MADSKTTELTAITTLTPTDAVIEVVDDLSGTPVSRKMTPANFAKAVTGYTLYGNLGNQNPADATTYYFGHPFQAGLNTTAGNRKIRVPKTGTITRVDISIAVAGTLGSANASVLSLRLNNTTDTTLDSTMDTTAVYTEVVVTGLSVAVTTGAHLELKWVTPTWTTNPTTVSVTCQIWVE